jgi:hypothetical protein
MERRSKFGARFRSGEDVSLAKEKSSTGTGRPRSEMAIAMRD